MRKMCSSEMLQHNWHNDWHKNAQKPIFNSAKPVLCERERNLLTFCLNKRLEDRRRGRSSSRTQESNIKQVWSQTISILSNNSCKERTQKSIHLRRGKGEFGLVDLQAVVSQSRKMSTWPRCFVMLAIMISVRW